jgi:hypothetical protein
MGYNTLYKLFRVDPPEREEKFLTELDLLSGQGLKRDLPHGLSMSWYEHENDIALTMMNHDVDVVIIAGQGEELGDVWEKTFRLDSSTSVSMSVVSVRFNPMALRMTDAKIAETPYK